MEDLDDIEQKVEELEKYVGVTEEQGNLPFFVKNDIEKLDRSAHALTISSKLSTKELPDERPLSEVRPARELPEDEQQLLERVHRPVQEVRHRLRERRHAPELLQAAKGDLERGTVPLLPTRDRPQGETAEAEGAGRVAYEAADEIVGEHRGDGAPAEQLQRDG
eukprot:CAMPEP_0170486124 /NCGR_PEP_ID=MMETSP0208-20121228/5215_1 /TAXON_ID=197538 /ORGANISM="Strombidium inclinatum, Strain S3" /LENGTH=163 /DNA_ID=CAMNT_0010759967 /DNA_START=237 /DNA_END=726 /DNA_ORIENTATION=+